MSCCKKMCRGCSCLLKYLGNFLQHPLLLLIRLYWGLGFLLAGVGKFADLHGTETFFASLGFPWPMVMVLLAATAELVGGACLILGLAARFFGFVLSIMMIVAYSTAHVDLVKALPVNPQLFIQALPFNFLLAALLIFCFGAGKISLDYLMGKCCDPANSCKK